MSGARSSLSRSLKLRAAVVLCAATLGGCLDVDDSPSMQAELRAARAELVEATREMRAATDALIKARAGAPAPPSKAALAVFDRFAGLDKIVCPRELRCTVPRSLVDQVRKSEAKLKRQASLRPSKSKGKVVGYRIDKVEEGSLPARLGLKRGDVLESVQTIKLTSAKSMAKVLDKLKKAKKLTAVFKRAGKRTTLRVDVVG